MWFITIGLSLFVLNTLSFLAFAKADFAEVRIVLEAIGPTLLCLGIIGYGFIFSHSRNKKNTLLFLLLILRLVLEVYSVFYVRAIPNYDEHIFKLMTSSARTTAWIREIGWNLAIEFPMILISTSYFLKMPFFLPLSQTETDGQSLLLPLVGVALLLQLLAKLGLFMYVMGAGFLLVDKYGVP